MCITTNHADLSATKILSIPLDNGRHFISYSNKVKNLSGKPNSMILPIPGETDPSMFHNTEKYAKFMDEITKKCNYEEDYLGIRSRGMSKSKSLFMQFESGQYTIGLTKSLQGIKDFIGNLPEDKRPEITEDLQKFFSEKYKGWSFAVCVFDSEKTIDSQPIAFEYIPMAYNLIFYPTVDSHDGGAPNINEMVDTDHTFIYEHTGVMKDRGKFDKTSVTLDTPNVPDFLKDRKYRMVYVRGLQSNGDSFINMDDLSRTDFSEDARIKRVKPVAIGI
jgi:hypothetical protein